MTSFLWLLLLAHLSLANEINIKLHGSERHFVLVTLPDTQYYTGWHKDTFEEQTSWCCECEQTLGILYVAQLGDIVHYATGHNDEWREASQAMGILDQCDLPWAVSPGNHDSEQGAKNAFSYKNYDRYFTAARMHSDGSYPEHLGRNTYRLATVSNDDGWEEGLIFIHLEYLFGVSYGPELIQWADDVLNEFSNRRAILTTHYVGSDCSASVINDVQGLLDRHCNVILALGGHNFECGGERTTPVASSCGGYQFAITTDFQDRAGGGDGWLRYYNFSYLDSGTLSVCAYTYSPTLDEYETDPDSYFRLLFAPPGNVGSAGTADSVTCPIDPVCHSAFVRPAVVLSDLTLILTIVVFMGVFFLQPKTVKRKKKEKYP